MQIFISYAREDYATAKKLFDTLSGIPEVQPWLDKESLLPGTAWEEEILRALDASQFVILLLSNNSLNKRGFVQKEIAEALERFKRVPPGQIFLLPARIEDCTPRQAELKKLNWLDLFGNWNAGINQLVRVLTAGRPTTTPFDDYVVATRVANPKIVPIVRSHPKSDEILRAMYSAQTSSRFPQMMSVDGELVHNPIYQNPNASGSVIIGPGSEGQSIRLMLLDLYLIKAFDANGQPLLLQYFSGTDSAGWQTWLFPHGLGFQRSVPDVSERMTLNARDFETTAGLSIGSVDIDYIKHDSFLVSVKPDFGYRHELVLYCYLFCTVHIRSPSPALLRREFTVRRGDYERRFKWFYLEELQSNASVLQKNGDVIKGIHTIFATSLVTVPLSVSGPTIDT